MVIQAGTQRINQVWKPRSRSDEGRVRTRVGRDSVTGGRVGGGGGRGGGAAAGGEVESVGGGGGGEQQRIKQYEKLLCCCHNDFSSR